MDGKKMQQTAYAKKVGEFFKKNYPLFVAPLCVAVLYALGLAYYGVFPFGREYTVSSFDLSAQIIPFIEHFFDVFKGRSTLSYTYSLVGGMDVLGSLLYCAISPFTPLFFLFGESNALYATGIVMLCKLSAIAFAGTWFAQKLFKGIPNYICIGIGVLYAYSGYTFMANTYINWLDFLIYAPFCVWAFCYFVKTGRFLPFSILTACCIYTCFSIACFSMFILFPALIFYGIFCVEKERRTNFLAYLCLAFAVAVGLAMPVLLPALASYLDGGRGGGLFEKIFFGFELSEGALESFDKSEFFATVVDALYAKVSYILSDGIFVILTLGYFLRTRLKTKLSVFMLVAGVLTLIPVFIDEAMLLLNMGSYMAYALRFGFLNTLYFLGGACLFLENLCYQKDRAYDGGLLKNFVKTKKGMEDEFPTDIPTVIPLTKTNAWNITAIVWGILGVGFFTWFLPYSTWIIACKQNGTLKEQISSASKHFATVMELVRDFSSNFAHSWGAFEIIASVFCVVAVVSTILLVLTANKRISAKLCALSLIPMLALQVGFYNQHLIVGNRSSGYKDVNTYANFVSVLDEKEDGEHYRIYDYDQRMSANVGLFADANAFTVFSSMTDKDAFITWEMFGFRGTGKNSYKSGFSSRKSNYAEELAFSFLGYKYIFVPNGKKDEVKKWKQLKQVEITDENGKKAPLESGGFSVYENTTVFPLGYKVDNGEFRFAYPNIANATNRKNNQFALYEFLRGESVKTATGQDEINYESVADLSEYLWQKSAQVVVGAGEITAKVSSDKSGECLMLNFSASEGYQVKVNGKKAKLVDNDLGFLCVALEEGENTVEFVYRSPYVKYFWVGGGSALLTLAFAILLERVKKVDGAVLRVVYSVIAVAGIVLAILVVSFFMIFPTGLNLYKWLCVVKEWIAKWTGL